MFERINEVGYQIFSGQIITPSAAGMWAIFELITLTGLRMAFGSRARLKVRGDRIR